MNADKACPAKINETSGIPFSLEICVHQRVMLRLNYSLERKLANDSIGIITRIEWRNFQNEPLHSKDLAAAVFVKFDHIKEEPRIEPRRVEFPVKEGNIERLMLPFITAYAVTAHKLQGSTLSRAVIDLRSNYFGCGQKLVAVSRMCNHEDVEISDVSPNPLLGDRVCYKEALVDMERLRNLPAFQ